MRRLPQEVEQRTCAEEAVSMKERVPLDGWWPMPFISLAWLAGCGSHLWGTKISVILWIYCSAAVDLSICLDKKDKSYICPSQCPFFDAWFTPPSFSILYLVKPG
jgi:hypothetical protein